MSVASTTSSASIYHSGPMIHMPRLLVLASVLLIVSALPTAAQQAPPVRSDQDILVQLERDWDAAFHNHDVATIDKILADEFIVTYDDGLRADRKKELELAATFDEHVDSSALDDFIVKEYGNTAIVWFTLHLVGPVNGKPVEIAFQFTDVFVLRNGRWQAVSSQSTRIQSQDQVILRQQP
jgi:ketosteroid isomerase-like protein